LDCDALVPLTQARPATPQERVGDYYYNLTDITRILSERYGYRFTYHDIPSFADEVNRRCTPQDPLYPLVDFITRSADKITAMRDKRYDNTQYRQARALAKVHLQEPALTDTVDNLVRFLRRAQLITEAEADLGGHRVHVYS
jgi:hypothetical protein